MYNEYYLSIHFLTISGGGILLLFSDASDSSHTIIISFTNRYNNNNNSKNVNGVYYAQECLSRLSISSEFWSIRHCLNTTLLAVLQ